LSIKKYRESFCWKKDNLKVCVEHIQKVSWKKDNLKKKEYQTKRKKKKRDIYTERKKEKEK
jgi:hypothetical protein